MGDVKGGPFIGVLLLTNTEVSLTVSYMITMSYRELTFTQLSPDRY